MLPSFREHQPGPRRARATVASGDSGERSCFCFLETRDQGVSGRQSPSQGHFLVAWCPHQRLSAWVGSPFPLQETTPGTATAPRPRSPTSERDAGVSQMRRGGKSRASCLEHEWGFGGSLCGGNMLCCLFVLKLTGLGRIERGQPCNACGDQCPGFALHKWR